jgi:hypothetical protein
MLDEGAKLEKLTKKEKEMIITIEKVGRVLNLWKRVIINKCKS